MKGACDNYKIAAANHNKEIKLAKKEEQISKKF